MKAYYDLHIHSCLSPCADDDSTPHNIVNMAALNGLNMIAVTDHNSCQNCAPAVFAAEGTGILVIPGMELTTAEDVHILCLFEQLTAALEFERYIQKDMLKIKNRTEIFGNQLIYGCDDKICGIVENLLLPATAVPSHTVSALIKEYGGVALPAHIDRPANGMLSVLGGIEDYMGFAAVEYSNLCTDSVRARFSHYLSVTDSDAHSLGEINEAENFMELPALSAKHVIKLLRGE